MVRLITISSSWSAPAPEELTDSATVGSAARASAPCSSMSMWALWLWDTRFSEASLTSAIESAVVYRGSRFLASPTVSCVRRKLAYRMSMYDNNGLSINKAGPKGCQVVQTGVQLRMRCNTQSCPSEPTNISDRSTKFRSLMCTTLMSDLNFFLFASK